MSMESAEKIAVNVGGTEFQTTRTTLKSRGENKLSKLADDNIEIKHGSVFVDRDPTVFMYILNFMRDGRIIFPSDNLTAALLYQEAKYYELNDLIQLISRQSVNAGGYCDLKAE